MQPFGHWPAEVEIIVVQRGYVDLLVTVLSDVSNRDAAVLFIDPETPGVPKPKRPDVAVEIARCRLVSICLLSQAAALFRAQTPGSCPLPKMSLAPPPSPSPTYRYPSGPNWIIPPL